MLFRMSAMLGLAAFAAGVVVVGCGSTPEDNASNAWANNGGYGGSGGTKDGGTAGIPVDGGGGDTSVIEPDGGGTGCKGDCTVSQAGPGTAKPFIPGGGNSSHVGLDPSGALVLDRSASGNPNLIWIANTGENTVLKVDTNTFQELGRYYTGSGDPSRTSVDSRGNVFVGNRSGESLTHISAAGAQCPDTNHDGQITTSSGPGDLLAPGQDDCVLWETALGGDIRGVAAQDIVKQVQPDPDLPPQAEIHRYVWTGGLHGQLYKLDAETGQILITMASPTPIYGLALDGNGQLWMSSGGSSFGRVDTTKCIDDASCAVAVCDTTCDSSGMCSDACDSAVLERIGIPDSMYGITVDFKQRVWLGGGGGLKRYNPHVPAAERFVMTSNGFSHGVAADAKGFVWGATKPDVVRLNGDTLEQVILPMQDSKGMAVDTAGKIWNIDQQGQAVVITPGPAIGDNAVQTVLSNLTGPYTYSDMTGLQASLASNDPGYYRQIFEGCPAGAQTTWSELSWDAETPANTSVTFRVRTAATEPELQSAVWVVAALVPPDSSPADLVKKFLATSLAHERFLEIEVWLAITQQDPTGKVTPKVNSFGVTYSCPSGVH